MARFEGRGAAGLRARPGHRGTPARPSAVLPEGHPSLSAYVRFALEWCLEGSYDHAGFPPARVFDPYPREESREAQR